MLKMNAIEKMILKCSVKIALYLAMFLLCLDCGASFAVPLYVTSFMVPFLWCLSNCKWINEAERGPMRQRGRG